MKIEEIVQPWYKHFLEVEQATLIELLLAANHMDIQPLIDLVWLGMSLIMEVRCFIPYTCHFVVTVDSPVVVCDNEKGMTSDEIREMFEQPTAGDTAK